jgi:hypothetical protein
LFGDARGFLVQHFRHAGQACQVGLGVGGVGDLVLRVEEFRDAGQGAVLLRDREGRGAAVEAAGRAAEREAQAGDARFGRVGDAVVAGLRFRAQGFAVDGAQARCDGFDFGGPGGVAFRRQVFQLRFQAARAPCPDRGRWRWSATGAGLLPRYRPAAC